MSDPIVNRFVVFVNRMVLFVVLWTCAFCAFCYFTFGGAKTTPKDWWALLTLVMGPDCPPTLLHWLILIAALSAAPVILIFWTIASWWRGQGIASLQGGK